MIVHQIIGGRNIARLAIALLFSSSVVMLSNTTFAQSDNENWTRFLSSDGTPAVVNADLPSSWDANSNIQWKTELPGPGASSPIVLNGKIYLTCYTGYGDKSDGKIEDLTRHLICIDRGNGKIAWTKSVDNGQVKNEDPYKSYITHHGYATNTPATDGKMIYAYFGKAGLIAYDLDGNEIWKRSFEGEPNKTRWGSAASPILNGDHIILNAIDECGKIFALNKMTGETIWEFNAQSRMAYSTPNLVKTKDGKSELILAIPEKVIGLDPETGKQKWFAKTTLLNEVNASIMVDGDIAYIYGGYQGVGSLAVRAGGEGDVTDSHVLWATRDTSYVATPVLNEKHVYWVDHNGIANCVSAETGEQVYRKRVPGVEGGRGVKFFASMVLVGDKYLAVSRKSGTFVLSASPEFNVVSQNVIQGDETEFNGTPAISGNQLLIRSNSHLYCIGK